MRKTKLSTMVGGVMVAAALATPGHAASITCSTYIDGIGISPGSGIVTITARGLGILYMCSLKSNYGPSSAITPAECQGQLALYTTAKAAKTVVEMFFDYPAGSEPASCSAGMVGTWSVPSPYPFLMMFG